MFREIFNGNSLQSLEVKLHHYKKLCIFSILFLTFITVSFSQNYNIDYYGVVSKEIDANMAKMTSDLYYTQLSEISNFSISDKRPDTYLTEVPDFQNFSTQNLSFYTVIQKDTNSDSWITTYHVVDRLNNEEHKKRKQYDSFYKILMESKNILKETIKNLIENDNSPETLKNSNTPEPFTNKPVLTSTEILSGTWTGEDNINKIVILRGGRGFIIFNNGASMNVTINISEEDPTQIIVSQNGKANASFYTELPRSIALKAALSASPIKWIFKALDNNTLIGNKETLIPNSDNSDYTSGLIEVKWQKTN